MKWIKKIIHRLRLRFDKKYRKDTELIVEAMYDMMYVIVNRLPVAEACMLVSMKHPSEWPDAVLFPYPDKRPNGDIHSSSIFGNTQHQAMDRTRSISLMDALLWTELCDSKGDVRRAIKNNGIMVNRKKMTDPNYILSAKDALPNIDAIVLENGKYNFGIIEMC